MREAGVGMIDRVANGLVGQGLIHRLLRNLPFVFQLGRSEGLSATYYFTLTGQEELKATVVIRNKMLQVSECSTGAADLRQDPAQRFCNSARKYASSLFISWTSI